MTDTERTLLQLFDLDPDDPTVVAAVENGRAAKAVRDAEEANYRIWIANYAELCNAARRMEAAQ